MILHVESNAPSYLSESCGRSHAAGCIFKLYTHFPPPVLANSPTVPPLNGAIYVHCQILKEVLSSYFIMARRLMLSSLFLLNLVTHNPLHQLSQIIAWLLVLLMILFAKNAPKRWIVCVSIGCTVVSTKVNFGFFGKRACSIVQNYFTKHHPGSHHIAMQKNCWLPTMLPFPPLPPVLLCVVAALSSIDPFPSSVFGGKGVLIPEYNVLHEPRTDFAPRIATRLGTCM